MSAKLKFFSYAPETHTEVKGLKDEHSISKIKFTNPTQRESFNGGLNLLAVSVMKWAGVEHSPLLF